MARVVAIKSPYDGKEIKKGEETFLKINVPGRAGLNKTELKQLADMQQTEGFKIFKEYLHHILACGTSDLMRCDNNHFDEIALQHLVAKEHVEVILRIMDYLGIDLKGEITYGRLD